MRLSFQSDISPFLVHLTRAHDSTLASDVLKVIIEESQLRSDTALVGDGRFGMLTYGLTMRWVLRKSHQTTSWYCLNRPVLHSDVDHLHKP